MIKKNIKLDKEEQAIEDSFDEFLQGESLDADSLIESEKILSLVGCHGVKFLSDKK
ncbi:hypothetical protein [Piscirickettsia salmonis]|uniref:hypothetical protein n=1 Tax=Piscirickettsia salmonis TaxID=1238 RepID=UPI0007D7B1C6|nr:hypothetical protein A0O36_02263 [Piscirickettsiaceae bacterium NZ-RLO1]